MVGECVAREWFLLGEAVVARCEAPPSPALPLPPILKGALDFFGVIVLSASWEDGGTDPLFAKTVFASSPACVFSGTGDGECVGSRVLPPMRKLPGLTFAAAGAATGGDERCSDDADFRCSGC